MLGVERLKAYEGVSRFIRDPYALSVFEGRNLTFVNALSANDVSSTQMIYDLTRGSGDEELVILINNRGDRPARAKDMARLCSKMQPDGIWLLGENRDALMALRRKAAPRARLESFEKASQIPFESEAPRLILAVGNIKNEGIRLVERAKAELKARPVMKEAEHVQ